MSTVDLPSPFGKLHVHRLAAGPADLNPLICLHPAPFDGTYFADFARRFAGERDVWAPDYPGYGASDAPQEIPTIGDYAAALLNAFNSLDDLSGKQLHLLGFHTGCLIACEMALQVPGRIGDLVLIDVPYFTADEQQKKYRESVTDDPSTWGFAAAFSYPCKAKLQQVQKRVLTIATGSNLAQPTAEAATTLPGATLQNYPDITRPAFRNGGAQFAASLRAFLHS